MEINKETLHKDAREGRVLNVRQWIEQGKYKVNDRDSDGRTAFHVRRTEIEGISVLIKNKEHK